jgi:hypothetical protein
MNVIRGSPALGTEASGNPAIKMSVNCSVQDWPGSKWQVQPGSGRRLALLFFEKR